jgi:hypothetical protein
MFYEKKSNVQQSNNRAVAFIYNVVHSVMVIEAETYSVK